MYVSMQFVQTSEESVFINACANEKYIMLNCGTNQERYLFKFVYFSVFRFEMGIETLLNLTDRAS